MTVGFGTEEKSAINEQRPFFDIAELDELLDRTKELQAEVQKTPLRKPVKRKGPSQTVIRGSSQSNRDRADLVALRRLGTVEDCAKVVEFLATDLSDYVTGAVIPIDGGLVRG